MNHSADLEKKKREAIKRRKQREASIHGDNDQVQGENKSQKQYRGNSDYEVINTEDEFDEDIQSLYERDDEEAEDETSAHLIKAVGSTFQNEFQYEIQKVTNQQGFLQGVERKSDNSKLNKYKFLLSMDNTLCNRNDKIWLFWINHMECDTLEVCDQHITCWIKHVKHNEKFIISLIYAKCKEHLRRPLWEKLNHIYDMDSPWCTIGDFNVITSTEEKHGGMPYNMNKSLEFIDIIEACGCLMDIGYSGHHYTWCNQRSAYARVVKRLDRAMVNVKCLECMPQTTISHLLAVGSDNYALLMKMDVRIDQKFKYFKMLHCWTKNDNLKHIVQNSWEEEVLGDPMLKFHQNMRKLASTLSTWSKKEYSNVFSMVTDFEEQVKNARANVIQNYSEENRAKLHLINAQYIKYLKLEASILKQKIHL
ncbi:uncharacterized protein LOC107001126 [Solanum pennellii]|uniref:Uncharacterized protein LOC107001126 n=1 Tax=Solanum pennellii TaxID=28526 RepID=A0ABM1FC96_SOLPN|nr:uncharacterized protein LOC107001126 [Solanum pennellii]